MTEISDCLKPNNIEKMDMLLRARCACANFCYVWELYRHRDTFCEWCSNIWPLTTKWMKIQYLFFPSNVCQWNGNGNKCMTSWWFIWNVTVLALKELCCLLDVGISQHLLTKRGQFWRSVSYYVAAGTWKQCRK